MRNNRRIDLIVPYVEKEEAAAFGARWDPERKIWYAPPYANLEELRRWLPEGVLTYGNQSPLVAAAKAETGIALSQLLARLKSLIDQAMPDAIWVRAEISELRGKNGHLYLSLAERNERGDLVAQAKAVIWRKRAEMLAAKFAQATGGGLKTDIKILCLARVRLDPLYGLDLIIEDVDPSYTLGDLAARLARIRNQLQEAGLYDLNKQIRSPVEYVRVAVVSPETSAGLGDFRRETDLLQSAGLCDFQFFEATFQGIDAPASIQSALFSALAVHSQRAFDVLVVIRGGGSVTDLAWLNDLELAKLVCQSRIPVYTGIGHERDNTILDEVAHRRFDTPSKVALHIRTTIKENALAAMEAWERINTLAGTVILRDRTLVETQADRIEAGALSVVKSVEAARHAFARLIQTAAGAQIKQATLMLQTERRKLLGVTQEKLRAAESGVAQVTDAIKSAGTSELHAARKDVENLARVVVGLAPQSTLQRGFAIVRDDRDAPLASREAAIRHPFFRVEFRDGAIAVDNREYERGRADDQR
jgi:exodeoxyribonuclease VII large subunit